VCDQLAMRKMARPTYALAVSLLPATATVIGILVLAQIPTLRDTLGVCLVVLGIAVHRERPDAGQVRARTKRRLAPPSAAGPEPGGASSAGP
jgi:inner membrane transporter RhtA